ncbi:MAG: hypothetical protein WB495_08135, partial [Xanthobacteraceae bacterium]
SGHSEILPVSAQDIAIGFSASVEQSYLVASMHPHPRPPIFESQHPVSVRNPTPRAQLETVSDKLLDCAQRSTLSTVSQIIPLMINLIQGARRFSVFQYIDKEAGARGKGDRALARWKGRQTAVSVS